MLEKNHRIGDFYIGVISITRPYKYKMYIGKSILYCGSTYQVRALNDSGCNLSEKKFKISVA